MCVACVQRARVCHAVCVVRPGCRVLSDTLPVWVLPLCRRAPACPLFFPYLCASPSLCDHAAPRRPRREARRLPGRVLVQTDRPPQSTIDRARQRLLIARPIDIAIHAGALSASLSHSTSNESCLFTPSRHASRIHSKAIDPPTRQVQLRGLQHVALVQPRPQFPGQSCYRSDQGRRKTSVARRKESYPSGRPCPSQATDYQSREQVRACMRASGRC